MKFEKGREKTGGRKKGGKNIVNKTAEETLGNLDCDPLEGMAIIAGLAMESRDFSLAGAMYKELAQYIFSKRRAVDVLTDGGESSGVMVVSEMVSASEWSEVAKESQAELRIDSSSNRE